MRLHGEHETAGFRQSHKEKRCYLIHSLSGEDPANPALQSLAGVGLLRGEFIFRSRGQPVDHPAAMQALGDYLERTCQAHAKKPVWYRLCDLWSDEADALSQSR